MVIFLHNISSIYYWCQQHINGWIIKILPSGILYYFVISIFLLHNNNKIKQFWFSLGVALLFLFFLLILKCDVKHPIIKHLLPLLMTLRHKKKIKILLFLPRVAFSHRIRIYFLNISIKQKDHCIHYPFYSFWPLTQRKKTYSKKKS